MNSHRLNQFAMAVLAALVLFFGIRTLVSILTEEHGTEQAGYEVPGAKKSDEAAGGGEAAEEKGDDEVLTLLASADPKKGESAAGICKGCHSMEKDGPNMVGPGLWDIVDRPVGSHEGYDYSPAVKDHGGNWDYVNLDDMIEHPNVHVPGTKMAMYPGMPDAEKRADVIAYLRTLSDDPKPLPEAGAGGDDAAAPEGGDEGASEEAAPQEPTKEEADDAAAEEKGPPADPMSDEESPKESAPADDPDAATDEGSSEIPAEESSAEDAGAGEEPGTDAGSESSSTDSADEPAETTAPDEEPNTDAGDSGSE